VASPVTTPVGSITVGSSVISVRTVSISVRTVGIAIIAVRTIAVAVPIMRISVPVVGVTPGANVDVNLSGRFRGRNRQSKSSGAHNHSQRISHQLGSFDDTLRG